jgi:hypothetical protein
MDRLKTDIVGLKVDLIGLDLKKKTITAELSKVNGEIINLKRQIIDCNKDKKKKDRMEFLNMISLDMQHGFTRKEIAEKHGFTLATATRHVGAVERQARNADNSHVIIGCE